MEMIFYSAVLPFSGILVLFTIVGCIPRILYGPPSWQTKERMNQAFLCSALLVVGNTCAFFFLATAEQIFEVRDFVFTKVGMLNVLMLSVGGVCLFAYVIAAYLLIFGKLEKDEEEYADDKA